MSDPHSSGAATAVQDGRLHRLTVIGRRASAVALMLAGSWCPSAAAARVAPPRTGVPTTSTTTKTTTTATTATTAVVPVSVPPTYPPVTVVRSTPVHGPIVDPWRPPSGPYGPGNRGVDIGTVPGAVVGSPADGIVTFAGAVGNSRFVVVSSSDGIRITVGFLATVGVRTGQTVRRGQRVGTAGISVHIGARIGDDYVDPTPLFSGGPPHVRLVPVPDAERRAR